METINAIYDGNSFKPIDPIPVNGKYEVIIVFTKPVEMKENLRQTILKHFGTWDDDDVKTIEEIIKERESFFSNREEV